MKALKEDNPFYGKKGLKIDNQLLEYIPPSHHCLFEEVENSKAQNGLEGLIESYSRPVIIGRNPIDAYINFMNGINGNLANDVVQENDENGFHPEDYFDNEEEF